jgi:hypothetical protein
MGEETRDWVMMSPNGDNFRSAFLDGSALQNDYRVASRLIRGLLPLSLFADMQDGAWPVSG